MLDDVFDTILDHFGYNDDPEDWQLGGADYYGSDVEDYPDYDSRDWYLGDVDILDI